MKMEIWASAKLHNSDGELKCGVNCVGELFLGDNSSGCNAKDTTENREKILEMFFKEITDEVMGYNYRKD